MDPLEIGLYGVDWIGLAQDRYRWRALVNLVMNLWVPQNAEKLPSGCTTCDLLSGAQLHRVSQLLNAVPLTSILSQPPSTFQQVSTKAVFHLVSAVMS
jgi:hypothetical protein